MTDFFISYTSVDRNYAEWIAWELEAARYTTIIQAWDFRPGENFVAHMHAASEADRTLLVLSEDYLKSPFAQSEWAAAFARDPTGESGKVVPVRVKPCTPGGLLAAIAYIDLVGLDTDAARETLLEGVRPGSRAKPAEAPESPLPPPLPPRQKWLRSITACVASAALVLLAAWVGLLSAVGADDLLEGRFLTHMQRYLPPLDVADIVLLRGRDERGPLGTPGPAWRGAHAAMVEALSRAGARLIVFDLEFGDLTPADPALAEAIRQVVPRTPVVLGALGFRVEGGLATPQMSPALAQVRGLRWGTLGAFLATRSLELAQPLEGQRPGWIRARDVPVVPSLALQAVMQALVPSGRVEAVHVPSADAIEIRASATDVLTSIPVDSHRRFPVDVADDLRSLSYAGIYAQRADARAMSVFRDKIVVVGFETDEYQWKGANGKTRYGMEIQASAIAQILRGRFLRRPRPGVESLLILALTAAAWWLRTRRLASMGTFSIPLPGARRGPVKVSAALAAAVVVYGLLAFLSCKELRVVPRFAYDLSALLLSHWAVGRALRPPRLPAAASAPTPNAA